MYNLKAFENPCRAGATYSAALSQYREEERDDVKDGAIAQAELNWYRGDGTDMFQNSRFTKQSQFVASLRAKNGGSANSTGLCCGETEVSDAVVVEEADHKNWDHEDNIIAAEANGSCLGQNFRNSQTKCRTVHIEVLIDLVDLVRMSTRTISLQVQLRENDWEL